MKTKPVMAFDLDGVIFDFEDAFCQAFGPNNRHMYDLWNRYPDVDRDLIMEWVKSPSTYADLLPNFGGIAALHTAQSLGFDVLFLTSRPECTNNVTQMSLEFYSLGHIPLMFTRNKTAFIIHHNQTSLHPIRILVDDCADNLIGLPSGVVGLCWEQPWNEGVYPRARYNAELMRVEVKADTESKWKEMK